ncbi:hypothetical protein [Endozoicomonas sp. SCSIO W0465]|uniref:hypothetical protein n=1 Tax=Endozoicomonas sp. SCSIO W0465 TaxID=2918516 RepID=UPI0020752D48|nr:hypothetical protein [Endozoicomonas sp. SCSIO W0465]USE36117.1 hypothetical protein MJO57_29415 [Endozoicomonas sp. SCSIO W0465]
MISYIYPLFSTVTGAGQPSTESDLPGTSQKVNADTHKTPGLDNPQTDSPEAKPLGAYSIFQSSHEYNDAGIKTLGTDDRSLIEMDRNVQAVCLINCLFLVHVPDDGEFYDVWHISGADLCHLLNPEMRAMMNWYCPLEVQGCDGRAKDWKEAVQENPGTTYLAGPNADDQVRDFFNIDASNVVKTEKGPVSITFDIATRTFQINK